MVRRKVGGDDLDVEFLAWVAFESGHPVHVIGHAEDGGEPVMVLVAVGADVQDALECLSRRWPVRQDMGPPPSKRNAEED